MRDGLVFVGDEAVAGGRGEQQLAARLVREHRDEIGFRRQIDEAADRLAIAAPARQLGAIEREEAPVGREQHQLVGGLGMDPEARAVALAVFDRVVFLLMALERAQPAFLRADDGDRLASRPWFRWRWLPRRSPEFGDLGGFGEFGAALAERGLQPEFRIDRLDFLDQLFGFQLVGTEQLLQILLFLG